jgi:hypothetical protein
VESSRATLANEGVAAGAGKKLGIGVRITLQLCPIGTAADGAALGVEWVFKRRPRPPHACENVGACFRFLSGKRMRHPKNARNLRTTFAVRPTNA